MAFSKDDDIVTLTANDGEEIDFVNIAGINYKGNYYAILQPVELLDGMSDDEALVFKVTRGPGGNDNFNIETDDKIVDGVFKEYNKLLNKQGGKKLKKSSGVGSVFGAATKVAKTTIWLIKLIIGIAIALVGVVLIIAGIVGRESSVTGAIVMCVIGAIALILGGGYVGKTWKKRK